jgi:predicted AlkP superfamily pyrophosphatase or phosphodiesterase
MKNFIKLSLIIYFFILDCNGTNIQLEAKEKKERKKLIILSIDGFPGYYANPDSEFWKQLKHLPLLAKKSTFSYQIQSSYPTLTYPAHTTMLTGVSPSQSGIYFNNPLDPMKKIGGDWYFFDEDIRVKTLMDFAYDNKLQTGNIYWPVTVGAKITYNLPQFWRFKNEYDKKLHAAITTRGLYKYIYKKINNHVGEFTGDEEKINAGIELWNLKHPDILLIYTTDLDTVHHEKGVGTPEAFEKLEKIDSLVGRLISKTNLYSRKDLGLLIVSDHGFKKVESLCYPNRILIDEGIIDPVTMKWNLVFKGLGGSAVLLENKDKDSILKGKTINIEKLAERIREVCPQSEPELETDLHKKIKTEINPNIKLFLHSNVSMAFSESLSTKEYYKVSNPPYYNHGFLPSDPEMETIGIFYGSEKKVRFENLKDVLKISCDWLNLDCPIGKTRDE